MSKSLMEFAKEYSRAWAVYDPDAIAAMHSDDSVFELHDIGASATGRAAVRDLIATLLAAIPDLRFELKRAHFGAAHFVTEYVVSGTSQGKALSIAGADVFTMHERPYWPQGHLFGLAGIPTSGRRRPCCNTQSAVLNPEPRGPGLMACLMPF